MLPSSTIKEAKAFLAQRVKVEGKATPCPCCDQTVKFYKRKLNSAMARALVTICRESPFDWFHAPTLLGEGGGDWAKVAHWGLLESSPEDSTRGGRTAGTHRITDAGRAFALDETTLPQYAVLYNRKLIRLEGDPISIRQALGDRFDYTELMNR